VNLSIRVVALIFDVVLYHILAAVESHRVDVVAAGPEFSSPQHFLDFWIMFKNFLGGNAFDCLGYLLRGQRRHALDQKVYMVNICSYFCKVNFISFADFYAGCNDSLFHRLGNRLSAIPNRAHQMIQQCVLVMCFVYVILFYFHAS